jgi:ABC-2 type transport system permease protein
VSLVVARELTLEDPVDGGEPPAVLVQVGEDAWAESDLAGLERVGESQPDEGADRPGPIPVAAAAQRGESRMVVIASDEFALNANLREDVAYDHGRDLILNAVGWLTHRDMMLGIRARQREHVKLVLLPAQLRRMTLVCLLGPPGFAVGLALLVLWRRRR